MLFRNTSWWLYLAGVALIVLHCAVAWLSPGFFYGRPLADRPIVTFVVIEIVAGAVFIAAVWIGRSLSLSRGVFAWIVVVGVVLRGIMLPSTPILEDDFHRYLWDGAVLANGISPYTYSPAQALQSAHSTPDELRQLAEESGQVIDRVNHPRLRTIYPPVAQAIFALSYFLAPWSLLAWRLVLALFDAVTLILLVRILKDLNLPLILILIYWWNPVVIKEIFNSAHMDIIAVPFVLASVLLAGRHREIRAAGLMAVATAVKIWPIVLVPVLLSSLRRNAARCARCLGLFVLVTLALYLPVLLSRLDTASGFVAYGKEWEMNDALFMLILWGVEYVLQVFSWNTALGHPITRCVVFAILVTWIGWLNRHVPEHSTELWRRCMLIVAAVFLLSPTQFPWYYVWLVPFLVVSPHYSLLMLTVLLPLYYLRFAFKAHDAVDIFDTYVVWLEYLPVWALILREWVVARRSSASAGSLP